ncbi:MAG: cysteine dioxygenase family protein [bacterium]|nr:cysteine dioxygenase family protein [bacterium]
MSSNITTIDQLITAFDDAEPSEQVGVLKRIDIPVSEFAEYATWCDDGYTRNCIARKDGFEFILLCWSPGAVTPIHGHDGQNCWVYQVDGSVREKRYQDSAGGFELTNDMTLEAGRLCYMHDRMGYHSLSNETGKESMTLHIYANPIDRCKVFNEERQCFETVEMQYDSIEGNIVLPTGS